MTFCLLNFLLYIIFPLKVWTANIFCLNLRLDYYVHICRYVTFHVNIPNLRCLDDSTRSHHLPITTNYYHELCINSNDNSKTAPPSLSDQSILFVWRCLKMQIFRSLTDFYYQKSSMKYWIQNAVLDANISIAGKINICCDDINILFFMSTLSPWRCGWTKPNKDPCWKLKQFSGFDFILGNFKV